MSAPDNAPEAVTLERSMQDAIDAAYMIEAVLKLLEDVMDANPSLPGGSFIHAALAGHVEVLLRSLNDADRARFAARPKLTDEEARRRCAESFADDPKTGISPERRAAFVVAFITEAAAAKDEEGDGVTLAVIIDRAKRRMAKDDPPTA